MRITKIEIKDFRAFQGAPYEFDLCRDGKNLLLFGENGSGKTSLFYALQHFLNCSKTKDDFGKYKNIFVTTADGYVKIEVERDPTRTFEWSETASPFGQQLMAATSKTAGFIDYKGLLETYFLQRTSPVVNVFNLLVEGVLANTEMPGSSSTFGETWGKIGKEMRLANPLNEARKDRLAKLFSAFNAPWNVHLKSLQDKTNELLKSFALGIEIELVSQSLALSTSGRSGKKRELSGNIVELKASYYGQMVNQHHHFLNEARLSAIAVCLYLASLLLNPSSQIKLLVLDDVLIGLDMSNRIPVLDLLRKEFSDWQIVLMTFDRNWFELVRERVKPDNANWKLFEMYCEFAGNYELPFMKQSPKDNIVIAKAHLLNHDAKAAVIYLRTAFEEALKKFCDRKKLEVRYDSNPRRLSSDDFWKPVSTRLLTEAESKSLKTEALLHPRLATLIGLPPSTSLTDQDIHSALARLIADIEIYRWWILNPIAHASGSYPPELDINRAMESVEFLIKILSAIK